jgi:hypothetical protein
MPDDFYRLPIEEQLRFIDERLEQAERDGIVMFSHFEPDPDNPGKMRKVYSSLIHPSVTKTPH